MVSIWGNDVGVVFLFTKRHLEVRYLINPVQYILKTRTRVGWCQAEDDPLPFLWVPIDSLGEMLSKAIIQAYSHSP